MTLTSFLTISINCCADTPGVTRVVDDIRLPENDERRHATASERGHLIKQLQDLLEHREAIEFAFIHGSFVDQPSFRDIDVAVYYDETLSQEQRLNMSLELASAGSHVLGLAVDVHALNDAVLALCFHASHGQLLTARDRQRAEDFQVQVALRYFDFEPTLERNLMELLEAE